MQARHSHRLFVACSCAKVEHRRKQAEPRMELATELTKFLGTVVATIVAIAAVCFPDTKSVDSGRLTRKGRWLLVAAIGGLALSGGGQITQMFDARATAEATRKRNEDTATRLERIPLLIQRSSFPLEPIELLFTLEYPMDQPNLKQYAERVRSDIVAHLRKARQGRGATSDDLADEDIIFMISNVKDWQPQDNEQERAGRWLMEDGTSFYFEAGGPEKRILKLTAGPPSIEGNVVAMPRRGDLVQKIELAADYKKRIFLKSVVTRNPIRSGSDVSAFSALDLIDRHLTWKEGAVTNLTWRLGSFAMRFSYDYGFSQNYLQLPSKRTIEFSGQAIVVTADNVGLADVVAPK